MRVIVPYATLYPETRAALVADGRDAEYVDVGRDPTAYHELLAAAWRDGQTFAVVEQDIVVFPGALADLEACPEPWCARPYELSVGYGAYLGCARFSAALLSGHSSVFDAIVQLPPDGTARRYWGRLDTRLAQVLEREGVRMHVHWPAVDHLNPAAQFRGAVNCERCGAAIPAEVLRAGPPPRPCPRCDA